MRKIYDLAEKVSFFYSRYTKRFLIVAAVAFLSAFAEIFGIFSLIPFVAVMQDPSGLDTGTYANIFSYFSIDGTNRRLFLLGFFCLFSFFLATILRVTNAIVCIRFFQFAAYELAASILWGSIRNADLSNEPKIKQIDIYRDATSEVEHCIGGTLAPIIKCIRSLVLISIAIITLAIISLKVLGASIFIFGGSFTLVYIFLKPRLQMMGQIRNKLIDKKNSLMRDLVTNHDLVRLHDLTDEWINRYISISKAFSKTQSQASILAQVPKLLIEFLVFGVIIIFLLYAIIEGIQVVEILPVIGLFVYGGYRLMPVVQDLYSSFVKLSYSDLTLKRLIDTYDLDAISVNGNALEATGLSRCSMTDRSENTSAQITLDSVSFSYPGAREASLKNCSMSINSGECVGVTGNSGSGKSTLLAVCAGLLRPQVGVRELVGSSKSSAGIKISYCPQRTNLLRGSIAENVAFGLPIDLSRIELCLAQVGLNADEFDPAVEVSEDGDSVSGGQLQRLGIARAIYRDADFLMLDEITSSLDPLMEELIVRLVTDQCNAGKGVVFVSHRISSLQCCDRIVVLDGGCMVSECSFDQLRRNNHLITASSDL